MIVDLWDEAADLLSDELPYPVSLLRATDLLRRTLAAADTLAGESRRSHVLPEDVARGLARASTAGTGASALRDPESAPVTARTFRALAAPEWSAPPILDRYVYAEQIVGNAFREQVVKRTGRDAYRTLEAVRPGKNRRVHTWPVILALDLASGPATPTEPGIVRAAELVRGLFLSPVVDRLFEQAGGLTFAIFRKEMGAVAEALSAKMFPNFCPSS